jgi:hypothetical protein
MLEYLAGASLFVAGGIFGVVCDRLWQKVEKRVRLRIHGGFRYGVDGEGIWFKVKNEGKEKLPPIRLCIFTPELGTYYIFPAVRAESERNELWPGQEREFFCNVSPNPDPRLGPGPMLNTVAKAANDPRIVFRVRPVDGETIIFENRPIGKAVACLLAAQVDGTGMGHAGGCVWGHLNYERRGPVGWVRQRLYIRSLLKEAERASKRSGPATQP